MENISEGVSSKESIQNEFTALLDWVLSMQSFPFLLNWIRPYLKQLPTMEERKDLLFCFKALESTQYYILLSLLQSAKPNPSQLVVYAKTATQDIRDDKVIPPLQIDISNHKKLLLQKIQTNLKLDLEEAEALLKPAMNYTYKELVIAVNRLTAFFFNDESGDQVFSILSPENQIRLFNQFLTLDADLFTSFMKDNKHSHIGKFTESDPDATNNLIESMNTYRSSLKQSSKNTSSDADLRAREKLYRRKLAQIDQDLLNPWG